MDEIDGRKQPTTVYGDPIGAVHVIAAELGFQAVALWSEKYKAYLIESRMPWTPEGATTWRLPESA